MFHYYQIEGGDEVWRPVPQTELANLVQSKHPMFVTVLGVDRLISSTTPREEVVKAGYMGPLYFDWDSPDIAVSIRDAIKLITKLETAGLIVETCQLYATGGKGFHMEISMDTLLRDQKKPLPGLPVIYKEMAMHYVVDALDLRVYSTKRGRMWRQPNVLRPNGRYKVPITWAELKAMTPEVYEQVTSQPRTEILRPAATYCLELAMEFERFRQKVDGALKSKGRRRSDERLPDKSPSIQALLSGRGIKAGTGFQQLSMQLAVIAHSYGWSENELVEKAQGLCKGHEGDGSRYNTQAKREAELRRMWAYMEDNPCYELSVGAIKTVLAHPAADLSGVPVTRDEVEEGIAQSEGPVLDDPDDADTDGDDDGDELVTDLGDEYEDLSNVTLSKRGVYAATELGPKRICGVGFHAVELMLDVQSNRIDGMNVTLGTVSHLDRKPTQQTHAVDLDTFESVQKFNRFLAQFGHAFQGSDTHVRSTFMKLSEMAKKSGSVIYTTAREGMDILSVPGASSPALREPFICWVSEHGVVLPKHVEEAGLKLKFQGYPDPRGQFRTDITDAVTLPEYVATKGREHSQQVVQALLTCQSPQFLAKVLGWMVACYFRMLFHKAYGKFPLLHVNGAAGSGKCLGYGTPVLMADGSIKPVQDVQVGDQLLGPDGGVRNVLSLARGREDMYRVNPVKGDSYVVNGSHILSLRKSEARGLVLSDGTHVPADADVVNVDVRTFITSSKAARKSLKGWRADAVDFHGPEREHPIDPYYLGVWLGDGRQDNLEVCKPESALTDWMRGYAERCGLVLRKYQYGTGCPSWAIVSESGGGKNALRTAFHALGLFANKHVPASYLTARREVRAQVLAGLLDTDGHVTGGGYDWISKSEGLADDLIFLARSLGLAAYKRQVVRGVKSIGFTGTYYRVSVSGDCSLLPTKLKHAPPRLQVKRHRVTGISVEPLGEGDYYGFELDGDKLFLLGDFTVTHNTETTRLMLSMFYTNVEPKMLSPTSTAFALTYSASGSVTPPVVIDEYKPHEMPAALHDKLKLMFRDAYNGREVQRGGGGKGSDDYRTLHTTQLLAPVVFIAEAMEEEAALMERVVLATMVRPNDVLRRRQMQGYTFMVRNKDMLSALGHTLMDYIVHSYSVDKLRAEFDPMLQLAYKEMLLHESDLNDPKMTRENIASKQANRERSVFNYTVAQFGLVKLKEIYDAVIPKNTLGPAFQNLGGAMFTRMSDLAVTTQAEYMKVLNSMADMSYIHDMNVVYRLIRGVDYDFRAYGGRSVLELYVHSSYAKYRVYCRNTQSRSLYAGSLPFTHGLRDCPAFATEAYMEGLSAPGGTLLLYTNELAQAGFRGFKE